MTELMRVLKSYNFEKPSVLLDQTKVKANIARMANKAKEKGIRFRPHFKTHQSAEIGEWFRTHGVQCITVSSVDMAYYFADHGWDDITIAVPINTRQLLKINELAKRITLNILIDSHDPLPAMEKMLTTSMNVWIKIDVGYRRVGIPMEDLEQIESLVTSLQRIPCLHFSGLLTHAGHTYKVQGKSAVQAIHDHAMEGLIKVKQRLQQAGHSTIEISMGDTPSCSLLDDFTGVDEMRPGNFVFYDLTQARIGACSESDIAVVTACPVVRKFTDGNRLVIYGGAVHLSKDSMINSEGSTIYGCLTVDNRETWVAVDHETPLISLSQEVGTITVPQQRFQQMEVGQVALVLPVHSCLTCDMYKEYYTLDGSTISRFRLNDW